MSITLSDGRVLKALPNGAETAALVVSIGGNAELEGYGFALPNLSTIRGWAFLRGYAFALPSLTKIGGGACLQGYAHIPSWIFYAGDSRRGYSFWADLSRGRVRGGWCDLSPAEARAHWRKKTQERDLAEQCIGAIERNQR